MMEGDSQSDPVATDLCSSCGLCCDGTLFHTVRIGPDDDPSPLRAYGLHLTRRKGQAWLKQPCPAHQSCSCAIYTQRPARCRLFVCRQLEAVQEGLRSEEEALACIEQACAWRDRLRLLVEQEGNQHSRRPLSVRVRHILSLPRSEVDPAARQELLETLGRLEDWLDVHFRRDPLHPDLDAFA